MSEFWNEKYNIDEYFYGTEPNAFFKTQLSALKPGRILLPAEGEGRNALYAAQNGWEVTAFDPSSVAQTKAFHLAKQNNVQINYILKGYQEIDFKNESFDVIGLTFTHMPPELRKIMHNKYQNWLKPDGFIIMEAFSKEQLSYNSGGPKDIDMLFSKDELLSDFVGLSEINISVQVTELNEGHGHQGKASVINFIGKK